MAGLWCGLAVVLVAALARCQEFSTGAHHYVGCFLDSEGDRDLGTRAPSSSTGNLTSCVTWCRQHYFPYAGLQRGAAQCWCGNSFGKHGPGACGAACPGAAEDTCGGDTASSVYRTGVRVPGPPAQLTVTAVTDSSVAVSSVDNVDIPGVSTLHDGTAGELGPATLPQWRDLLVPRPGPPRPQLPQTPRPRHRQGRNIYSQSVSIISTVNN